MKTFEITKSTPFTTFTIDGTNEDYRIRVSVTTNADDTTKIVSINGDVRDASETLVAYIHGNGNNRSIATENIENIDYDVIYNAVKAFFTQSNLKF